MSNHLDYILKLANLATPLPWEKDICAIDPVMGGDSLAVATSEHDAAYIVAACNSLPELIAENRALRERVRELEIREVDYIEERDALLSTKYALERQRAWLAERLNFICHSDTDCVLGCPDVMNGNCSNVTRSQWIEAAKEAGE